MKIALIVPWREQESRRYAQKLVLEWYEENLPDADLILADDGAEPFCLSGSRNMGVRRASRYDVCIINDADTIPELAPLSTAIEECLFTRTVHLPYTEYRSLGITGTQDYLRGVPLIHSDFLRVPGACSGVYVTTPETWWMHGGQDEEFRGWGFEDAAWFYAHATLLGVAPTRHEGAIYAFHHESQVKEGEQYSKNGYRMALYEQAIGDVEAMRELVFGTP